MSVTTRFDGHHNIELVDGVSFYIECSRNSHAWLINRIRCYMRPLVGLTAMLPRLILALGRYT